jgi:hypothetical protein
MMSFSDYVEFRQAVTPSPLRLTRTTAISLASPGLEDTKRAIERAKKRGTSLTTGDLTRAISPETYRTANQAVQPAPPIP